MMELMIVVHPAANIPRMMMVRVGKQQKDLLMKDKEMNQVIFVVSQVMFLYPFPFYREHD